MTNLLKQGLTISGAFLESWTGKIPRYTDDFPMWYRHRMDMCNQCDMNTMNMSEIEIKEHPAWKVALGGKKARCAVCGCFIKEKCWVKSEKCEHPNGARWMPVYTKPIDTKVFSLRTAGIGHTASITPDKRSFIVNIGNIEQNKEYEISLVIETTKKFVMRDIQASCGCFKRINMKSNQEMTQHYIDIIYMEDKQYGRIDKGMTVNFLRNANNLVQTTIRINANVNYDAHPSQPAQPISTSVD